VDLPLSVSTVNGTPRTQLMHSTDETWREEKSVLITPVTIVLRWILVAEVSVEMIAVTGDGTGTEDAPEATTEEDHLQGQDQDHQEDPDHDQDHGTMTDETDEVIPATTNEADPDPRLANLDPDPALDPDRTRIIVYALESNFLLGSPMPIL